MKVRLLALGLALALALATPQHLSAQVEAKTPPGRIQKASLPKTLAELENLISELQAPGALDPLPDFAATAAEDTLTQLSEAAITLQKQTRAQNPSYLKALDKLTLAATELAATARLALAGGDELQAHAARIRQLALGLQKSIGAAALVDKKGGKLSSSQKQTAAKLRQEAAALRKKLADIRAQAPVNSANYRATRGLERQTRRLESLNIVDTGAYALLLALLNNLWTDYRAYGNVLRWENPRFYELWNTVSIPFQSFEEIYYSEEIYEITSWSEYSEFFQEASEEIDLPDDDFLEDEEDSAGDDEASEGQDEESADDEGMTEEGEEESADDEDMSEEGEEESTDDEDMSEEGEENSTDDEDMSEEGEEESTDDEDMSEDEGDDSVDEGEYGDDGGGDDGGSYEE
jgi:hypothetical protein